ncbi:CpXC domain-containing protein [Streptococcus sciuri]|uniref:CpXC domain-containing protein n=1 Tax=Streptococcus sciuri TaxID=2973939 RepID=A0ABT2F505_9STRE|nr:CpXC domain-containing protein [Streptococcus sciuri]MCS4487549.1 CpXC domain-containing protein [Streptococcus sciuri]
MVDGKEKLKMTNIYLAPIKCNCCDTMGLFERIDRVDAVYSPELISSISDWEFFKFSCSECGNQALIEYPTIFHDENNLVIVQYSPKKDSTIIKAQILSLISEGIDISKYQIRVVSDMEEFIEKVQIFSEGFDDRAIELMKYLKSPKEIDDIQFTYDYMVFTKVGDIRYQFMFVRSQDVVASLEFDRELYDECYSEIRDVDIDLCYINEVWAEEFVRNGI